MPHYKDGTQAQVGDFVVGKPYNTPHVVAGTIISITPSAESCNCKVLFTQAIPADVFDALAEPKTRHHAPINMARFDGADRPVMVQRRVKGEQHGSAGPEYVLVECVDYGGVRDFQRADLIAAPAASGGGTGG